MSDCRKCAEFDWCVENEDCGLFKPKTQTNADRIRAMTDEELAEWLGEMIYPSCMCCPVDDHGWCSDCKSRWMTWLKQKVEDD